MEKKINFQKIQKERINLSLVRARDQHFLWLWQPKPRIYLPYISTHSGITVESEDEREQGLPEVQVVFSWPILCPGYICGTGHVSPTELQELHQIEDTNKNFKWSQGVLPNASHRRT